MADFTSGFWAPFIAITTIVSILACLWLLFANSKNPAPSADNTTGHVWDGDLKESNNPLPRWWSWLFILTIVFGLVYLWLYPGLGSFAGSKGWSQAGQYEQEAKQLTEKMEPLYAKFVARPIPELVGDAQARGIGERLFLNNCAQCHGSAGTGGTGFPNLTDGDWLWGGSPEQIVESIAKGRNGIMPPQGEAIGSPAEVEQLAQFVLSLSGSATDPVKAELGKGKFAVCSACHGPKGEGNPALGAPNLTDKVWLHGGGLQNVVAIINNGKNNAMPAHADKLTAGQVHVLAAYVYGMSRSAAPTAAGSPSSPSK